MTPAAYPPTSSTPSAEAVSALRHVGFRMGEGVAAPLNQDGSWMGEVNENVTAAGDPELTLAVPVRLLGGTFVETPGRLGPWQAGDGTLYFVMEPADTFNVLMVVGSRDEGASWRELDGEHRPRTDDLEGFATTL